MEIILKRGYYKLVKMSTEGGISFEGFVNAILIGALCSYCFYYTHNPIIILAIGFIFIYLELLNYKNYTYLKWQKYKHKNWNRKLKHLNTTKK